MGLYMVIKVYVFDTTGVILYNTNITLDIASHLTTVQKVNFTFLMSILTAYLYSSAAELKSTHFSGFIINENQHRNPK